jgi:hypothetical protein
MSERVTAIDTAIRGGALPVFLLTMELPSGERIRVANRAVSVAGAADGPYHYQPLLSGIDEFVEELDVFSLEGTFALTQAAVSIATTVDLAAKQGDWEHVSAATAELALWWDGMKWKDRRIILEGGTLQGIEFGRVGEETSITIESSPPVTSASVGTVARLAEDWPPGLVDNVGDSMSDLDGREYVYVFGEPRSIPAYKVGNVAGSNRLVLCGHRLPNLSPVTATEDGLSIVTITPANGRAATGDYAYLDSATPGVFAAAAGAYTWSALGIGGIARADDFSRPCTNAGHILRRLLRDSGLRVDWRRCRPALDLLAEWPIGFYTDTESPAIDIIRDMLVPYLPIIEVSGGEGVYFVYSQPHRQPVEGHLILGQQLVGRMGGMTLSDPDEIRNAFTINYFRDEFNDKYTQSAVLDDTNSALCMLSRQALRRERIGDTGVRADDPIDCPVVWDNATALRVLLVRASRRCIQRRILTYQVAPDAYWIDVGAVYLITDPEVGVTQRRAVLTAVNRSMAPFVATFELVDRTPLSRS